MHSSDARYEEALARFWAGAFSVYDPAHDMAHIKRVVNNALAIAEDEKADVEIVRAAAWFHDLINLPKDHPDRRFASMQSAQAAMPLLRTLSFPQEKLAAVAHAIEAHSFSASIRPETGEAFILRDADRLDSLGAIGIARTFSVGGQLGRPLFDPGDPFADNRVPDDQANTLDHFFVKLLKLPDTMATKAGRRLAVERVAFMRAFLDQLRLETAF